jgi:hypothetical protein
MSRSFKVVVSQIIFGGSSLVNICAIRWEHGGCSPSVEQDALMKCGRYLECKQMCKEGIEPDDVTFVCLLSACSHAGLVDDEGM